MLGVGNTGVACSPDRFPFAREPSFFVLAVPLMCVSVYYSLYAASHPAFRVTCHFTSTESLVLGVIRVLSSESSLERSFTSAALHGCGGHWSRHHSTITAISTGRECVQVKSCELMQRCGADCRL